MIALDDKDNLNFKKHLKHTMLHILVLFWK